MFLCLYADKISIKLKPKDASIIMLTLFNLYHFEVSLEVLVFDKGVLVMRSFPE